jgi:hypothetical protein
MACNCHTWLGFPGADIARYETLVGRPGENRRLAAGDDRRAFIIARFGKSQGEASQARQMKKSGIVVRVSL